MEIQDFFYGEPILCLAKTLDMLLFCLLNNFSFNLGAVICAYWHLKQY